MQSAWLAVQEAVGEINQILLSEDENSSEDEAQITQRKSTAKSYTTRKQGRSETSVHSFEGSAESEKVCSSSNNLSNVLYTSSKSDNVLDALLNSHQNITRNPDDFDKSEKFSGETGQTECEALQIQLDSWQKAYADLSVKLVKLKRELDLHHSNASATNELEAKIAENQTLKQHIKEFEMENAELKKLNVKFSEYNKDLTEQLKDANIMIDGLKNALSETIFLSECQKSTESVPAAINREVLKHKDIPSEHSPKMADTKIEHDEIALDTALQDENTALRNSLHELTEKLHQARMNEEHVVQKGLLQNMIRSYHIQEDTCVRDQIVTVILDCIGITEDDKKQLGFVKISRNNEEKNLSELFVEFLSTETENK